MTGAMEEEVVRAAGREKGKEKVARDTPAVGKGHARGSPKKKEFVEGNIYDDVFFLHFSSKQPLIVHKLIEYTEAATERECADSRSLHCVQPLLVGAAVPHGVR